jgi:putative transposase
MAKHASKTTELPLVEGSETVTVQVPLPLLELLGDLESAFLDLCVRAGRQVFEGMMERDRTRLCGPKDKHNPERTASRAGSAMSEVTLGGRRILMRRLRARSADGEVHLPSFAWASSRDPLDRHTMAAIACGVSTRKYARSLESLSCSPRERSVSKSTVSRRFVALSAKQMTAWLSQPLDDLDVPVVMIDGIEFRDHTILIALGIDSQGKKHVLGLREGTTENGAVVRALLSDLLERGLDSDRARLFVIDGAKALRSGIQKIFGKRAVIQRCQIHKQRNVLGHLPDHLHATVAKGLREAWDLSNPELAKRRLEKMASSLEADHSDAAASIREGLDDTLTLQRLGIEGALYRTLRSTNIIENLNGSVAHYTRNVRRWRGGSMIKRWVSAAILEASRNFRRIRGFRELSQLSLALNAHCGAADQNERVA